MVEHRAQDGRFTSEHADTDILAAVRAHEPAATSEIADEVGMTRQGADRRLRRLRDEGRVNSKKIAASLVWFTGSSPEPTERPAPAEWKEITRNVLSRDEYTCQECGADVSQTGSEIHHITPLAGGGDNSLSNLETLCPDCHREKHRHGTLDAVRDVFDRVRGPVVTSSDVAEALDCTTEAARQKLTRLYDRGEVDKRKTGRTVVYWRVDEDAESGPEQDVTPSGDTADPSPSPADSTADAPARADEQPPDDLAGLVDEIAEDVLPGSGAKLTARRDALHAAVEYLREHGTATPQDFQTDVYPDHQGRYTAGEDPAYSWWTNCIYKGLRALADRTDAVEKADTTGEWSYNDEALPTTGGSYDPTKEF